jgi:ABC-type phosphate transport system substrate-binding protein
MWNDVAIKATNPGLASLLPPEPIRMGYSDDTPITLMVTNSLSLFSPQFAEALALSPNRTLGGLPAAQGDNRTMFNVGMTSAERISWLASNPNSLTFITHTEALAANQTWMLMVNKANKTVSPSIQSVQSAMSDYQVQFLAGSFQIDILDAPGNDSWPMAFLSYMIIPRATITYDCSNVESLLEFVAWIQSNDGFVIVFASSIARPPR